MQFEFRFRECAAFAHNELVVPLFKIQTGCAIDLFVKTGMQHAINSKSTSGCFGGKARPCYTRNGHHKCTSGYPPSSLRVCGITKPLNRFSGCVGFLFCGAHAAESKDIKSPTNGARTREANTDIFSQPKRPPRRSSLTPMPRPTAQLRSPAICVCHVASAS